MRAGAAGPRRERDAQRHASEGSCRAVGRVPGEPRGGAPWCPAQAASAAGVLLPTHTTQEQDLGAAWPVSARRDHARKLTFSHGIFTERNGCDTRFVD